MRTPINDLHAYPGNARQGDLTMIKESLTTLGQYRPIVANADGTILAGNHTWQAATQLGWDEIDVTWIDVDETTARKINLADNRANDLADYDDQALAELLALCEEDFTGTGYHVDDLESLIDDDPEPSPEVGGDPEYRVVVECRNEAHQTDLLHRFEAEGLVCQSLIA